MWRRYGRTGISSPAIRPIEGDQAPAQLKTSRVAMSPVDVRTPCTRPDETSTPMISTPSLRRAARRFGRIPPPGLGQADAMPHLHVVAKVLDLLRKREYEEVADLSEVGRVSG